MGVTLDLRLIDHERIVVRGLPMVNEAIRSGNPEVLREYLATLPVDVNQEVVERRQDRLAKLREFNSPNIILENEARLLRFANGEAYRPDSFRNFTLNELRELLGTWCWMSHCYSLDKAWDELHWFLEPMAGLNSYPLHPIRRKVGDPDQSLLSRALQGAVAYPTDMQGEPIIRTLGSSDPDCFGYNPPDIAQAILPVLEMVDRDMWVEHVPFRCELYRRGTPEMDNNEIASRVEDELLFARETFPQLLKPEITPDAAERGYGVSCEYSL